MYRIIDKQNGRYYLGGRIAELFGSKQEVIERLSDYHSKDFDDEYYGRDIWEWINANETEDERLRVILEYGEWEIEEVKGV